MKKQLVFFFAFIIPSLFADNRQIIWNIDNLTSIGEFSVISYGNPKIITTDAGNALEFNANAITAPGANTGERIQIKGNPLSSSTNEFTIEMIFKPYPTNTDFAPRVVHICRPDSMSGPRVLTMETRSTSTWTTDFYIKSVTGSGRMGTTPYPTNQWIHMAMTCKNNVMNGYVNGVLDVTYTGTNFTGLPASAEVSLGGRMNNVNYFKGAIRKLIFTPFALSPSQFTYDGTTAIKTPDSDLNLLNQNYPNPVNDRTLISYTLINTEKVNIVIFNNIGQKVQTLVNEVKNAGKQEVIFYRNSHPAGLYYYIMTTASGYIEIRKMTVQ